MQREKVTGKVEEVLRVDEDAAATKEVGILPAKASKEKDERQKKENNIP